jgi:hypothetical protein
MKTLNEWLRAPSSTDLPSWGAATVVNGSCGSFASEQLAKTSMVDRISGVVGIAGGILASFLAYHHLSQFWQELTRLALEPIHN